MQRLQAATSWNILSTRRARVVGLVALAGAVQVAAGVGVASMAGWSKVAAALGRLDGPWLGVLVGGLAVSLVGYWLVYRDIYEVAHGPGLRTGQLWAAVVAGFGGFLAHGGAALDVYALQGAGADEEDAKARVVSLGGLEHGVLALGGTGAAIFVLVTGRPLPPLSYTLPWAVIPIPGFAVGFLLADHLAGRLRRTTRRSRAAGIFVDGVLLIERIFRHPVRHAGALGGMALYWAGDLFAGWCGLAAYGVHLDGGVFVVGFTTGLLFSRRTGPLAGAGTLTLVLTLTLWTSGAPFAAAVAGIFTYRFLTLWLPLPFSLAALPTLRAIGRPVPGAPGEVEPPAGEPALEADRRAAGG